MTRISTSNILRPADLPMHVADAIRQHIARTNTTLKQIARQVGAAERTVSGWANAEYPPAAENLIELARLIPELRDVLLQLIGYQPSERERRVNAFMAEFSALMERP